VTLSLNVTGHQVFGRMGGLLLSLPMFSAQGVPRHVGVLGAFALTLVIGPLTATAAPLGSLAVLIGAFTSEVMLGLLMGSCVRAIFGALGLAAEVMSGQMGLAMATLFDPMMRSNQGLMGTLGSWIAGAVFLGAGLHLRAIEVVAGSFRVVAPGEVTAVLRGGPVLLDAVAATVVLGVQLAGPVVALVWMVNCFVAVLSRLAPNMNVFFSVGMVMTNVAGIMLFGIALPYLLTVHIGALAESTIWMIRILKLVA
jgi:flagellar biosynthetic protein FliR